MLFIKHKFSAQTVKCITHQQRESDTTQPHTCAQLNHNWFVHQKFQYKKYSTLIDFNNSWRSSLKAVYELFYRGKYMDAGKQLWLGWCQWDNTWDTLWIHSLKLIIRFWSYKISLCLFLGPRMPFTVSSLTLIIKSAVHDTCLPFVISLWCQQLTGGVGECSGILSASMELIFLKWNYLSCSGF